MIREHVSLQSEGRWRYSGETDIVLIGAWLPEDGQIVIDWESLSSGVLVESGSGQPDRSLGALVEFGRNAKLDIFPADMRVALHAAQSAPSELLRLVADQVAGMTDGYAIRLHARLTGAGIGSFNEFV